MVPRVSGAAETRRIGSIVDGTTITVAEPIPYVRGNEIRKKRVAITSEDPTAKANPEFVAAMHSLAS
ncbi:MAG TPA: hypothetical protein VES60_05440 [Nakamurella sp.]|nr:hypothetical protein [Nakamurella sp.]